MPARLTFVKVATPFASVMALPTLVLFRVKVMVFPLSGALKVESVAVIDAVPAKTPLPETVVICVSLSVMDKEAVGFAPVVAPP